MFLTLPLHRRAQALPGEPFTVCGERVTTNAEALEQVARIAAGLRERGVSTDSSVAVLDVNTDFFFLAAAAIAWADGVVVPVNYRWSVPEIAYSLVDADVRVLILGDRFLPLVEDLQRAGTGLDVIVHAGAAATPESLVPLSELAAANPIEDARRRGDKALGVFYTGGSTGVSKGVVLSHRSVLLSATAGMALGEFPIGGTSLLVAPAFHMAGFCSWILSMLQDQVAVPIADFVPQDVLDAIERHRVTQATLVPTMIQMIVDHPSVGGRDLSSLEMVVYGASPISEALMDKAKAILRNCRFTQNYGMTELAPVATVLRDEDHRHPVRRRSAGRAALPVEVRIVDPHDNEVPRGAVGEIAVAGDTVMLGYLNKPEETAAALRNGWMHTGDGGYMDEDGYVYVVDRIKDMIITGGENVYSIEVENVVAKYPGVMQCAVIGVPDEQWGERVHAVVQLEPGHEVTIEELRLFCKQEIAGYKCPRSLAVVDSWPLSAAGKILKRELRAQLR